MHVLYLLRLADVIELMRSLLPLTTQSVREAPLLLVGKPLRTQNSALLRHTLSAKPMISLEEETPV